MAAAVVVVVVAGVAAAAAVSAAGKLPPRAPGRQVLPCTGWTAGSPDTHLPVGGGVEMTMGMVSVTWVAMVFLQTGDPTYVDPDKPASPAGPVHRKADEPVPSPAPTQPSARPQAETPAEETRSVEQPAAALAPAVGTVRVRNEMGKRYRLVEMTVALDGEQVGYRRAPDGTELEKDFDAFQGPVVPGTALRHRDPGVRGSQLRPVQLRGQLQVPGAVRLRFRSRRGPSSRHRRGGPRAKGRHASRSIRSRPWRSRQWPVRVRCRFRNGTATRSASSRPVTGPRGFRRAKS